MSLNRSFRPRRLAAVALAMCMVSPMQAHAAGSSAVFDSLAGMLSQYPQPEQDIAPDFPQPMQDAGLTGLRVTAPFHSEPGRIRQTFSAPGPHAVDATITTKECTPFYKFYNEVLRLNHGVGVQQPCYAIAPEGETPAIDFQFIYPTDLAEGELAPLMVLSPGIGVEPGMMHERAKFYASHGYIVALGYSVANWFGEQMELAGLGTHMAEQDPQSPLHGHVDFSRIILIGHSAGGGSAMRQAGILDGLLRAAGRSEAKIAGAMGINPGPSDFGLASPPSSVPSLFVVAEHETLVAWPLSKIAYDRATGPKWWTVARNAAHGQYLDAGDRSVYDALVISFADYTTKHDSSAARVYEGPDMWLANDPELMNTTSGS